MCFITEIMPVYGTRPWFLGRQIQSQVILERMCHFQKPRHFGGLKVLTTDSLQRKGIPDSDDCCYLDNYATVGSSGLDFQFGG